MAPLKPSSSPNTNVTAPQPRTLDEGEAALCFTPPLYSQRAQLVQRVLQRYSCRRIVDAGCSYGDLLLFLLHASSLSHQQLTHVTAIDLDAHALDVVSRTLPSSSAFSLAAYTEDCAVQCLQGDLTSSASVPTKWLPYPDAAAAFGLAAPTVDAVFSIEVVEHIPPHLVAAYTHTILCELGAARGARVVLLTTPNRDENHRLPRRFSQVLGRHAQGGEMPETTTTHTSTVNSIYRPDEDAPRRRHDEHFFELTRAQWQRYVQHIEACYGGYWRAEETVLLGGGFTQGTLFVARGGREATAVALSSSLLVSRDVAMTSFPFEAVFGMSPTEYAAHLHALAPPRPTTTSTLHAGEGVNVSTNLPGLHCCGCDMPYVRTDHRVLDGVPLWERLRDTVRRSTTRLLPCAGESRVTALAFGDFYTSRLAPPLHAILEDGTLPLLQAALAEQRELWTAAVREDAARWLKWCRGETGQAVLRACRLRRSDAHARPASGGAASRPLSSITTLQAEKGTQRTTRLFPSPSVATAALDAVTHSRDVQWSMHCAEGLQVLERGHANSTGLLLMTWLSAQVEAAVVAAAADTRAHRPAAKLTASSTDPTCGTMKALAPHVLRLLFFMVSVDVLPDVYAALYNGGGVPERTMTALHRDVRAVLERSSASAAAVTPPGRAEGRCRRRRRAILTQSAREPHVPYWLHVLLKTTVTVF